jgi:SAM-dependent methyltransferase
MTALPPRVAIIQRELDRFPSPRYLEIGIFDGLAFLNLEATLKVAVDPKIRVSRLRRAGARARGRVEFHEIPSDEFFEALPADATFDVVFVDGLHLYEQALRDAENALAHLAPGGVVLMHDCNPPAEPVAARDPAETFAAGYRAWCGDVWKSVVHLRATRPDLDVCVLDTDFGIGVVRRGAPAETVRMSPEEISRLTYADLAENREHLLGLRPHAG